MSARALAARLGYKSSMSVYKLERAEEEGTLTLEALARCAAALDCEVQYRLVPRTSLSTRLHERALELARQQIAPVATAMALESQELSSGSQQFQVELRARELLNGSWRKLW